MILPNKDKEKKKQFKEIWNKDGKRIRLKSKYSGQPCLIKREIIEQ